MLHDSEPCGSHRATEADVGDADKLLLLLKPSQGDQFVLIFTGREGSVC